MVRLADYRRGFVRWRVKEGARWEWVNDPVQAPPYLDATSMRISSLVVRASEAPYQVAM